MERIISKENPLVKRCRRIAGSAAERRESGLLFLEGFRLCRDAWKAGMELEVLLVSAAAVEKWQEDLRLMAGEAVQAAEVSDAVVKALTCTENSQGVFALVKIPQYPEPDWKQGGAWLLLDRLQDPGNLGTILRCAEAFGIQALILGPGCADPWSPKVLRSAMGSSFRLPVFQTGNLPETVRAMKKSGVRVYAALLAKDSRRPEQLERGPSGIAVVIGNEGAGVSEETASACGESVCIPMTSAIESLNAAAAATVLMWEISGRGGASRG